MKEITVILNGYTRPNLFQEQYEAIRGQSLPPKEILYWQNYHPNYTFPKEIHQSCKSAVSNTNYGVWARFAYALNAKSDFVCIFDDDTIPGKLWLENCSNTFDAYPGLLGCNGVLFSSDNYRPNTAVGWHKGCNEETVEVDIVGHSWYFGRDMLSYFWRELPSTNHNFCVGEDIHFSYMLQKYSSYKTYVPPHPSNNKELWGSIKKDYGWKEGEALSFDKKNQKDMSKYLELCCKEGFKLIYQKDNHQSFNYWNSIKAFQYL